MSLPRYLCWLDLETTGTDPAQDAVIEVYAHFARFAEPWDLLDPDHVAMGDPGKFLDRVLSCKTWDGVDSFVVDMHARSGLLVEAIKSDVLAPAVDEELVRALPADHVAMGDEEIVLAGSSVHFDLAFVRGSFPKFAKHLSHRVFDVSAMRLLAHALGMPYRETPEEEKAHRAKADVMESIRRGREAAIWLTQSPPMKGTSR